MVTTRATPKPDDDMLVVKDIDHLKLVLEDAEEGLMALRNYRALRAIQDKKKELAESQAQPKKKLFGLFGGGHEDEEHEMPQSFTELFGTLSGDIDDIMQSFPIDEGHITSIKHKLKRIEGLEAGTVSLTRGELQSLSRMCGPNHEGVAALKG